MILAEQRLMVAAGWNFSEALAKISRVLFVQSSRKHTVPTASKICIRVAA
jgi:hypothetical protein